MRLVTALLILPAVEAGAQTPRASGAPQVTNLAGSRAQLGLFAQRLTLPAGHCSPIHVHNGELHGLVTRGVLRLGLADGTGGIEVREYPAGSLTAVPAGRAHTEGSAEGVELHVTGFGPIGMTVLDSTAVGRCRPGRSSGSVGSRAPEAPARLVGVVRDSAGVGVEGAQLIVRSSLVAASDATGRFEVAAVPAGSLAIHVRAPGYYEMAFPSVVFERGDTLRLDVRLVSLPKDTDECMVAAACTRGP